MEPNNDQIFERICAIRSAHPGNLMARHFDRAYFGSLDQTQRQRLLKIIRSGLDNPDSQMGAYALDGNDYEDFATLLEPMIRDYHHVPPEKKIHQDHDWNLSEVDYNLGAIDARLEEVSMRVRVGRNAASFPLPGAMTQAQRVEFEGVMSDAFKELGTSAGFAGEYLSLTPGSPWHIDDGEFQRRVEAHQMFKDMSGDPYLASAGISADWPFGRGMYISKAEDFIVWVGEEDHLRIMAMMKGGNLGSLLARLHSGLARLEGLLPAFAHSSRFGYLTSCPTNLGTAMRASLHIELPRLTNQGSNLKPASEAAAKYGLAVRGAGGEHSGAGPGGLVDISPRARMGVPESQIMQRLYDGAAALWSLEKSQ